MIQHCEFQNFKALKDVKVDLRPFTLFVGPNGAGKTSILEGIYCLCELLHAPPEKVSLNGQSLSSLYRSGTSESMSLLFRTGRDSAHLIAHQSAQPVPENETRPVADNEGRYRFTATTAESDPLGSLPPTPFANLNASDQKYLREKYSATLLRLDPSRLAKPSYSDDTTPSVQSDGFGIASVLAHLKRDDLEQFAVILRELQKVVPAVKGIQIRSVEITRQEVEMITVQNEKIAQPVTRRHIGEALVFDTDSGKELPARAMSEGTLIVLGLLTVLYSPQRPRVLLLDDIDRALHPTAQRELVNVLRSFLEEHKDNIQIVATSHSPYLLDELKPEEVWVTNLNEDGTVSCKGLNKGPGFDRWKDSVGTGEFWSMVGESWVSQTSTGEPSS